ncbi:bifunctional hydroxymethylpyrimidine kinase/phosphomethylpyrimidine kinase [Sphingomonas sp. GB1N7]|uniref:bifunctional hydroxymethylpyrimidine kinase/phosphomethylpyrimidine kinase n=1 Tax=Parasphingomonas caseinilytica TaxID=3096158 RepID=UPI002FC80C9D
MTPRILIIAGSDSGGGAGIQADIKTVTMLGGHAMTAITAITAQNTLGVQAVHMVPTDIVLAQIESCVSDIGVDAVKIGMIGSAETAHAVADRLTALDVPIVFDPVMVATSGSVLADAATIAAFERLMRIATLVTPNLLELAALHTTLSPVRPEPVEGQRATGTTSIEEGGASTGSARTGWDLARHYHTMVLVKGGHGDAADITDILYAPNGEIARWSAPRIHTTSTHGTGCTLASAIATGLGQGMALPEAIERAIRFVRRALEAAPGFGGGHGPMGQQQVTNFK